MPRHSRFVLPSFRVRLCAAAGRVLPRAGLLCALALAPLCRTPARAQNGPPLTVDASAGRRRISPDIYGVNAFGADEAFGAFMKELHIPVNRWGGDAATRYNWQADASNAGDDWFFMAGGAQMQAVPGASVDKLIASNQAAGAKTLLTIPAY